MASRVAGWISLSRPFDRFGASIARVDDINGDGNTDLAVLASEHRDGTGTFGRAYLFLGGAPGNTLQIPVWASQRFATQSEFVVTFDAFDSGDFNGDSWPDILASYFVRDSMNEFVQITDILLGPILARDACTAPFVDTDLDGICDKADFCAQSPAPGGDPDGDLVCDVDDNCDQASNPDQEDLDIDGLRDACDPVILEDDDLDGDGGSFNSDTCDNFAATCTDGVNDIDCNDGTVSLSDGRDICTLRSPSEAESLMATDYNPTTGAVSLTYTPACFAVDHNVVYGPLENVSTCGYSGEFCTIGNTGANDLTLPGSGSFFFLVVGEGKNYDASYGKNSNATERPHHPVCWSSQILGGGCI